MKRVVGPALVVALLAGGLPASAGSDPSTNALGSIQVHPHPEAGPEPVNLPVTVQFDNRSLLEQSHQVLLAFNVHDPEVLRVAFTSLETANGTDVPLVKDERDNTAQPRVFVEASEIANATGLEANASIQTEANGRFHVGFMVIPFDEDWSKIPLDDEGAAELYGYAILASRGHESGGLQPPLLGSGNQVPGPSALVVLILAAGLTRRRSGCRG